MTRYFSGAVLAAALVTLIGVGAAPVTAAAKVKYYYDTPPYGYGLQNNPNFNRHFGYYDGYYDSSEHEARLERIRELLNLIARLQEQLRELNRGRVASAYNYNYYYSGSEVSVDTLAADNVNGDSATLNGEISFDDSDYAYVWFEWGESQYDLDEDTTHIRIDEDEDEEFDARITGLDEDTRYYFRAVAEDEDGRRDTGSVRSFITDEDGNDDDDSDDEWPDVETDEADSVDEDSARLSGEVDMNDFENGTAFFVYGEDEDMVADVEDDFDTYEDVDESGDDLQKVLVDRDLDGSESYRTTVWNLDENTDHFFTLCVAFEDEDDDEALVCGDTDNFETD